MGLPIQNQGFGGAPAFYPEEITQVDTKETSFIASDVVSTQEPARPPYVLGLLAGPQFRGLSIMKNVEGFFQVRKQVVRPVVSTVEKFRTFSTALGGLVASSFGAALGMFVAGPAPFIPIRSEEGVDFTADRLQKLLKQEEADVLIRSAAHDPEHQRLIKEALAKTGKEKVDALLQILERSKPDQHPCPDSMVYVSQRESRLPEDLCIDQDDQSDFKNPAMPLVGVDLRWANQLCSDRQARLPSVQEYQHIASFGRRRHYPTLDNTAREIHFHQNGPRALGPHENAILYTQPDGSKKPIYNLTGNVRKWLAYGTIGGGSWKTPTAAGVHAWFRTEPNGRISSTEDVGFRCVTSPQKISR